MAPPASAINTLIPLVAQLYVTTAQILPNHRKPANTTVCNTLAIWGRLTPTPYQNLGVVSILEELVVGKFADVIYILLQINAHRHRQRTPQAAALLQQAASILAMPEVKKKMTVEKNPNLIDDKFERATKGMRFHIYSQLLETYVGVIAIAEAFWGIKMAEPRRMGLVK